MLKSVEYVDVPLTRASSVSTTVSAYTVSPSGRTVTAEMPAVVANMSCINGGVVPVTVLAVVGVKIAVSWRAGFTGIMRVRIGKQ